MILQNFVKELSYQYGTMKYENGASTGSNYSLSNWLGAIRVGDPCSARYWTGNGYSNGIHWAIFVGKGDTEPTFTDYALVSKATELTWLSGGMTVDSNNTLWSLTSTFKNNTESPVVIKEVAMGWYHNSTSDGYGILIARSLLETPVTIAPGETYAFTYNIEV